MVPEAAVAHLINRLVQLTLGEASTETLHPMKEENDDCQWFYNMDSSALMVT